MNENDGYAVFFFPQALEALGEAIKPYLQDGPAGQHVVCSVIDTGGSFIEMTLNSAATEGQQVERELMVPSGMVRMIVSAHSDEVFGFGPRAVEEAVQKVVAVAEGQGVDGEPKGAGVETSAGGKQESAVTAADVRV